ncbi:hypothetical protein SprV_0100370000 [Sparganum proliferum]
MHFQSRVSTNTVHKLLFADNCALIATSEEDMQRSMELFAAACDNLDLIINTGKTVVIHRPPSDAVYVAPQINVDGAQLQDVENFTYLGSTYSRNTNRRLSGPPGSEGQPSLRLSLRHSLESTQAPHQHQTEDVQSGHPAEAVLWGEYLDGVQEAGRKTQPSPSQLSPPDIEAEVAGPDPGQRRTGMDGNPQHLRHVETAANALERPPRAQGRRAVTQTALLWRCRHGSPPTLSSSPALQVYSEDLNETPANRPRRPRRPRPGPNDLAESSKDRLDDLRSRCQCQARKF